MGNLQEEFDDVNDWVWENPEGWELEEEDSGPTWEDVQEWQGKGWLWE